MSEINCQKWNQSPLSYKNGLYLMYHVAKGRRNKKDFQETKNVVEVLASASVPDEGPSYKCSMCGRSFRLLSSFLLHVYRHSDPLAIQKDIKKEEELEESGSYLRDVGEVSVVKKEEVSVVKEEEVKEEPTEEQPQQVPDTGVNEAVSKILTDNQVEPPSRSSFTCHHCTSLFEVKKLLRKHLALHAKYFEHRFRKNQDTEKCDICLIETLSKESLIAHYFKSHKRSSRLCRVCGLNVGSNALRRVHERFFHKVEDLACVICEFGFASVKDIKKHCLETHRDVTHNCIHCHQELRSKHELVTHELESHSASITTNDRKLIRILLKNTRKQIEPDTKEVETKGHHCSYCPKQFLSEKLARLHETRQHLTSKEDDPGYTCPICSTSFSKRANGLRHARRMHGFRSNKSEVTSSTSHVLQTQISSSFSCDQCNKTFLNSGALITHSRKAHTTQELVFQCGICDKRVKSFGILREHIEAVHEKKLTYFCDLCGKGHARKSGLRTHMRVNHITTRDFVCPICQQRFAQQNQLNVHLKIHSTKKLHTCQVCQKSFAQVAGLNQHMSMHSDIPKYFCSICDLSFKYASSFYNHRKTHVSPNEHKCDECNRQCPSRFSLYVHRKTHHSTTTQTFDCSDCGKVFKRKNTLKYHILNKHTPHVNYQCEHCANVGFKTKRDRKRHMNTIHMQLI